MRRLIFFIFLFPIFSHAELVAYWPLDGDADDEIGNHDGAAFNVTFGADGAAAHTGTAAEFDGSSSTITVPHDAELNPESFTLSLWANADTTSGFASPLTSRDDTPGSVHGYLIYNDNAGNWNFWTGTGGPSGAWDPLAGDTVQTGNWTHLAIRYDATTQTKSFYINGELAASSSAPNLYSQNGPQNENLHIGSGADRGGSFFFDGLIDDIALWNEPLSGAAIKDIMNNGIPGGPPSINAFTASPPLINSGQEVTLFWETTNAISASISPDIGDVTAEAGSITITPSETTTYTLTVVGETKPDATQQVTVGVDVESLPPIITEFLADNETGLTDSEGEFSDWIEIHNPNPFAIDIGGWHLTDDATDTQKFVILPTQIEAGEFLILFASGKPAEVNFRLSKESGYLGLSDPDGVISQEFANYPAQYDDVSYGRSSNGEATYLAPSPGEQNGPPRAELGPDISGVTENPTPPEPNEDLLIEATITPRIGAVTNVSLHYRIGFGPQQLLPMTSENGSLFTATIPSSEYQAGEMIRWFVSAITGSGEMTREPPAIDPTESARYFGTIAQDPATNVDQPVLHWFVRNTTAADTRSGTRGSLYFEGRFYDNIFCRIRGQSTANWPKHKYKFDFYRGSHFKWRSDALKVEEFNLNSHYRDAYVRENGIFAFLNEAGSLAPETRYLWVKRNGNDFGLFSFVEQVDEEFLTRRDIDASGSMYKAINVPATLSPTVNSSLYRKVLRKDEPYLDLRELTSGINISNPNRFDFVADEVNLPNYINVMAAMAVPFNHDQLTKNYYVYHDKDREEWFRIAWDGDQGFPTGRTNGNDNWASPLYGDAQHTQELVNGRPNPTWQNHLHAAILDNPVTRQMYMRRLRTLMDEYLAIPEAGPVTILVDEGAMAQYLVPPDDSLEDTWLAETFDDSTWASGTSGFGYEKSPGDYVDLINTVVKPNEIVPGATSIYQRYPFNVDDPVRFKNLVLRMRYEDGFVAYLNGVEVARANVSGTIAFNSRASSHPDSEAVNFVDFKLPGASLRAGQNILAIQIINQSSGSSDLLCEPMLIDQFDPDSSYFETMLEGFRATIQNDVALDQSLWSGTGITNFNSGFQAVIRTSLPNRRMALFETYGPDGSGLIPESQTPEVSVQFGAIESNPASGNQDEEFVEITNSNDEAVDLSNWALDGGIRYDFPPGAVIPGNGRVFLSPNVRDFRSRESSPTGGEGNLVFGNYRGHLSNFAETITLHKPDGTLVAQTTTPNQPSQAQQFLVVSEVMYHPADDAGSEFIELLNISENVTLDLSGITFTDGIDYTFPAGSSLLPGERLLLDSTDFLGGTALSNGGESLKLEDATGGTIVEFSYDDSSPWPASADGSGASLVLINPGARPDPALASNWRASREAGGNPGTSDATLFSGDPNGDLNGNGTPDLIDYVLGTRTHPKISKETLSYQRQIGTDDAEIMIETSNDLKTWTDATPVLGDRQVTWQGDGTDSISYQLILPASPSSRFFRVSVQKN